MASDLINPQTTSFLERATRDPSIDVAKLEQLIALQERIADREAKRQFAEAMNAMQAEMTPIGKDRTNPHTKSRYATYEAIDEILRPLYTRHGFSVRFTTHAQGGRIRVACTVSHIGGHTETEHELESGPDLTGSRGQANKTEVQGIGSIVSYLKRYTLMAAFAVAVTDDETDDDGNGGYRAPPPPDRREQFNREVPMDAKRANGAAPADTNAWDIWLDTLAENAAALVTREAWDAFWTKPSIVRAEQGLTGVHLERFQGIREENLDRLFGIEGEKA